jgi:oligopeptide transport system ATP-binding protein
MREDHHRQRRSGLESITAGQVWLAGQDLGALSGKARKAVWCDMQVVFQNPVFALNPRRTIATSIAEPLVIHG